MSEEQGVSVSEQKKEDWMNSKWRPMMGWMYMAVCMMDFIGFPVLWSLLQAYAHGQVNSQWQPLTLQGAGLFHLAMGAVLGIAAYGRTKEKMAGAENGGLGGFGQGAGTTYVPPGQGQVNVSNQAPAQSMGGFGGMNSGMNSGGFGSTYVPPGQGQVNVSNQPNSGFGSSNNSFGGGFNSTPAPMAPAAPAAGFGSSFNSVPAASPAVPVNAKGQKVVPQDDQPAI